MLYICEFLHCKNCEFQISVYFQSVAKDDLQRFEYVKMMVILPHSVYFREN